MVVRRGSTCGGKSANKTSIDIKLFSRDIIPAYRIIQINTNAIVLSNFSNDMLVLTIQEYLDF